MKYAKSLILKIENFENLLFSNFVSVRVQNHEDLIDTDNNSYVKLSK